MRIKATYNFLVVILSKFAIGATEIVIVVVPHTLYLEESFGT